MTNLVDIEPKESIYEEIVTRDIRRNSERKRLDRSISCPASRKTSVDEMGRHNKSVENIRNCEQEESLYAVVNGDDLEFMRLRDLLEVEENKGRNRDVQGAEERVIAQAFEVVQQDRDLGENDSGCDCSTSSKDMITEMVRQRPNTLDIRAVDNATIYSEVLHLSPASQIDLPSGRRTRESDNPILRQEVVPSNSASPSTSVPPSRTGSLKRAKTVDSTKSASGDSGIQEDVYQNFARRQMTRASSCHQFQVYANASTAKNQDSVYANMDDHQKDSLNESQDSVYANMDDDPADSRPRASSRPIAIQSSQRKSPYQPELIYSDLDFDEDASISTDYLSSSPGNASSTSSGLSSFTNQITTSVSPPPLPSRPASVYARRRQTSFSSVSMSSYSSGVSILKAHFIGTSSVHRAANENIDHAIKETVHKTNMLEIKSVCVDIQKDMIKFSNLSSPYECVLEFSVDSMHLMDHYSKDKRFMGFVVSQTGKEAVCHVFQSDQTAEILETVKDVYREMPMRQRFSSTEQPQSLFGLAENQRQTSFTGIIKIGSLKVKKSYLVINDCIRSLLEKTNPKEYRCINLEITESVLLISNPSTGDNEEHHSVPWVLSLGLYNKDGRYFGYIVSKTKNGKTRMFCHVYKCTRVKISASILEGIRSACQNTLAPSKANMPRISNSMPRDGFRSRLKTSPDTISRCSNSSDETVLSREVATPRMNRRNSTISEHGESTPKIKRENSPVIPSTRNHSVDMVVKMHEKHDEITSKDNSETLERNESNENIVTFESTETDKPTSVCDSQESDNTTKPDECSSKLADSNESLEGIDSKQNVESIYANKSFDNNEFMADTVISDSDDNRKLCEESEINDAEQLYSTVKRPSPPRNEYSMKNENATESKLEHKACENSNEELGAIKKPLQYEAAEPHKEKEKKLSLKKSKIFRNTLSRKKKDSSKLSASMQSLDIVPKEEEEHIAVPLQREVHRFVISYLCSAVVKPPLKAKHVEKCLKQYQKEVGKKQKITDLSSLGNKLLLHIVTDEGITMADIRNPNAFRRHFPISTIDGFITHPENPDCFAFSTTVPGDEQHKYHMFYKARENTSVIKEAFDHLKLMQRQF